MKKYEFVGLLLAIGIIITTYSMNYFYDEISGAINTKYASANNFHSNFNIKSNGNVFSPLLVKTSKENYYRYELVEIFASYKDLNKEAITVGQLEVKVYKDNKLITAIGKMKSIFLKYNSKLGLWTGKWPIPYNPELGTYQVLARAMPANPGPVITATWNFNIMGRVPQKPNNGLCAMIMEDLGTVYQKKIKGPDGEYGDWQNIIKWAKYTGANAFFMLGAQTATYNNKITPETPFDPDKLNEIDLMAKEFKKNNLIFGAWIMTYGIQGRKYEKVGYQASLSYDPNTGSLYPSWMHISLTDSKRFDDLLTVVKRFNSNPNIDYIGFDYVRTGSADGYELAEQVIGDMSIPVPNNWDEMNSNQRMAWFANMAKERSDTAFIEKWEWWRAHKVAETINRLIKLSGTQKPIWVFTLGWEHGKQHGQDPLMFTDAGVSFDAVMLYEANQAQFQQVIVDWKSYVASQQVNIIVGNTVDITLLDSPFLNPPEEFVRRIMIGTKKIAFGGLTDGLFWHDVSRGLWSKRRGEYTEKEWFLTAAKSFSDFRKERGELGIILDMKVENSAQNKKNFTVNTYIENQTINPINDINVSLIDTDGVFSIGNSKTFIKQLSPGEIKIITFNVMLKSARYKNMIAILAETKDNQRAFDFQYISPFQLYSQKADR